MRRSAFLWILLVSGVGLLSLGAIAIYALIVTQPLAPLAQARRERSTFDESTFPTTVAQIDPNAIGWSVGGKRPKSNSKI